MYVIWSSRVKSMEKRLGLSQLSIISWVSAVEGCLLSEVPLYNIIIQCTRRTFPLDNVTIFTPQRVDLVVTETIALWAGCILTALVICLNTTGHREAGRD